MRFVIGTVTMALCCGFAGAQVWYVDVNNATRGQDGMTWSTAFTTIQPAIDAAYNAGGGEVWVAEGTYGEPRTSLVNAVETGSLVMREEVDLYGGFNGSEETRDQRDWSANDTVIDGTNSREGEPAHHVVLGADNAKIDGFTITGGDAKNRSGGGMYNSRVSPTVINCTIADNRSTRGGGGVLNTDSCAQFFNCLFYSNFTTSMGGAASTYGRSVVFIDCEFRENEVHSPSGGLGGALHFRNGSHQVKKCSFANNAVTPTTWTSAGPGGAIAIIITTIVEEKISISECVFEGNSAGSQGGAVFIRHNQKPNVFGIWEYPPSIVEISNCLFTDNSAEKGSALHFDGIGDDGMWNLQVDVINCTLAANVSETDEGAVYVDETRLTMWNNILRNAAPEIMHVSEDSLTTVIYSNVLGGHEGEGNIDAAPLFVDAENGDYHLHEGSPAIDAGTGEASRASEELGGNWRVSSALSPDTDLEGKRRPVNGLYDMGAYEFGLFGDVNKDGVVNAMDVQVVINTALDIFPFETAQDLTGDGKVNALDIQLAINAVLGQV